MVQKALIRLTTEIDNYDTYKDLYLSEKEHKEKLLQGIQPVNGLKARVGAEKADGTELTVTTQENAIKKTFDNRFAIPLDFDFFKHSVYPYGLREDSIMRLEFNSAGKVILCSGDTSATYKLSDIFLEHDAIFDEPYAMAIDEMYVGTSILYTKVESIHYQTLSKKDTIWKIDVNNLSVLSFQGLLLLFLDKHDDFANKNEEFYNPSINIILVTINGDPHPLFKGGLGAMNIYPELKKYFYKEHSDVTWKEFLTTKFPLWIDTRSSIDNTLHGNDRAVDKGIMLQTEKTSEASGGDLTCHVLSFGDAVAHLSVTDPKKILTIET